MDFLIRVKKNLQKTVIGKKIIYIYHLFLGIPIYYVYKLKYYLIKNKIKKPKFDDTQNVFFELTMNKMSISRFGDGEISWIFGNSKGSFNQQNSKELSKRLYEVINNKNPNILIAIPNFFEEKVPYFSKKRIQSRNAHLAKEYKKWNSLIDYDRVYADALITRTYLGLENFDSELAFTNWKKVWNNKKVVIVEGNQTRFGVGNDLLANTSSVSRIIAPNENAFELYNEILESALSNADKDSIFLICLGPTASILSYDLSCKGYQAIDIGHLDVEYEWYLRKATKKIPIPGKYVNEAGGSSFYELDKPSECKYKREIIDVVLIK